MRLTYFLIATIFLLSCSKEPDAPGSEDGWGNQPALPSVEGEANFSLGPNDDYINVMGNSTPRMPNFPDLKPKAGVARGYVADLAGRPLQGAYVGIRSTATGGYYSGASDETDANGYYEINVPWGAAEFYAAGYTIDYGEGRAVMGLSAADGKVGSFASGDGLVKNFVLLSYGINNKDALSQKPRETASYAGGCMYISYHVSDPSDYYNPPNYLPLGAEIQVTLTPDGPGLYGENKTFVINKKVSLAHSSILIMNVPVGKYTLGVKKKDGQALKLTAIGTYANIYPYFGLKPVEALGSAKLLFTPNFRSEPSTALPNRSNWGILNVQVEIP